MTEQIQRWRIGGTGHLPRTNMSRKDPQGRWVSYEDVKDLQAQLKDKDDHLEIMNEGFQLAADATGYEGDWFESAPIRALIDERDARDETIKEFIWGESNPDEYESEMTKLKAQLSKANADNKRLEDYREKCTALVRAFEDPKLRGVEAIIAEMTVLAAKDIHDKEVEG